MRHENMYKKVYMKTTWSNEKHDKQGYDFMQVVAEKNIPEHKVLKDDGYKVYLHSSSFYLRDLGYAKDLIEFLQEFVKEEEGK